MAMATVSKKTTGAAKKGGERNSLKSSAAAKAKKGTPGALGPVKPKPGDDIVPNNPVSRLVSHYVNANDGQTINATSLEKPGRILGLLFTAEWCAPCKGFIKQLLHWWGHLPEADRQMTSIIYCSSDKEEDIYQEHVDRIPDDVINWHYPPWNAGKAVKAVKHLKTRFGVENIPILLFIEADSGRLIRTDGRMIIDVDPEAKEREWKPLNLREELLSAPLIKCPRWKVQQEEDFERVSPDVLKDKYIGLLFFSDLFVSCVKFAPILDNLIKIIRKKYQFEVIYINAENEREKFYDHYHGDIPWLAFLHTDERRPRFARWFNITLVPQLIILDKDFKMVCHDGHLGAMHDVEGEDFPWRDRPVLRLTDQFAMALNVCPCLIWITDGSSAQIEKARTVMYPIALQFFKKQRSPTEFWDIRFFYLGADKKFTLRVKQFVNLSTEGEEEEDGTDEEDDDAGEQTKKEGAGAGACATGDGRQMLFLVNNPERDVYHLDKCLDGIDVMKGDTPTTDGLSYFIEEIIAGNRIPKKMKADE